MAFLFMERLPSVLYVLLCLFRSLCVRHCQDNSQEFKDCKSSLIGSWGMVGVYGSVQKGRFVQVKADWIQSKGYLDLK